MTVSILSSEYLYIFCYWNFLFGLELKGHIRSFEGHVSDTIILPHDFEEFLLVYWTFVRKRIAANIKINVPPN